MSRPVASEREIVIERVFDAPRELVYNAWTDPEQLAKWWGPEGVTAITSEHNFTIGGSWVYTMGPEGRNEGGVLMTSVFREIVPLERITTDDHMGDTGGHPRPEDVTVTAIFEDHGEKTKLTLRILHASAEDRRINEEDIKIQFGWGASFDSFDKYLAKIA